MPLPNKSKIFFIIRFSFYLIGLISCLSLVYISSSYYYNGSSFQTNELISNMSISYTCYVVLGSCFFLGAGYLYLDRKATRFTISFAGSDSGNYHFIEFEFTNKEEMDYVKDLFQKSVQRRTDRGVDPLTAHLDAIQTIRFEYADQLELKK